MAGAGKQRTQDELKNKAMLVVRNITKQEVTNVIFPNGITVGVSSDFFGNGMRVHGNARISGVVNAQGYKVNGEDLSLSTTPAIIVTAKADSFSYPSKNPNENSTPARNSIFITQLGQTTTLTAASITVTDATGSTATTLLGTLTFNSEASPGNSFSQIEISPRNGVNAPTYPLTVTVSHEGITTSKTLTQTITQVQSGDFRLAFTGAALGWPGTGVVTNKLYYPDNSPLTGIGVTAASGFAYTDGAGQTTGILNIGGVHTGLSGAPQSFNFASTGAARDNQMFYRPAPTDGKVTIHRVRGSISLLTSGTTSGDEVSFQLALYMIDYANSSAVLKHSYDDRLTITGNGQATVDLSSSEITPFQVSNPDSLFFALFAVNAAGGYGSSSTLSLEVAMQGFLEYSKSA